WRRETPWSSSCRSAASPRPTTLLPGRNSWRWLVWSITRAAVTAGGAGGGGGGAHAGWGGAAYCCGGGAYCCGGGGAAPPYCCGGYGPCPAAAPAYGSAG